MNLNSSIVAVITGAGSGIGRALAQNFAARGLSLALADIAPGKLEETARSCVGATRVTTHAFDVADPDQMNAFAQAVLTEHGRVNLVINNAGVALFGNFDQVGKDDFDWLMRINFGGVVNGSRAFLPMLKNANPASLVNVSSVFGFIAPPGQSAYSAAKFAVRGFTECLRHELAKTNVRVACVHPGGIQTNIARTARVPTQLELTQAQYDEGLASMEKLFITSPEDAAARVARGIERNQSRILIGSDATAIDWISRLFPTTYLKILERLTGSKI
jgi:NAD(P)-dependent dehydrogenase (short-subunit alcohol dehydrogenase family)